MVLPLIGWALFICMVWLPVERAHLDFCFNNYDLGIYAQALSKLSLTNRNPFLSTRGIRLFNDHFDPILFLFVPFKELIRPELLAIRIEMASILLASLAPLWLWRRRVVDKTTAVIAFLIILFSPMTLRAAFFPAHPGTWSLAPLGWFFAFLLVDKRAAALLMLVLVFACKEEYPVLGAGVAVVLWLQGRRQIGSWVFLLSFIWGLGAFILRPIFLGKSDFYTSAVVAGRGIVGGDASDVVITFLQVFLWVFGPWILLNPWAQMREQIGGKSSRIWPTVVGAAILLLIRLVGGYWENHRIAPLAILSAFMVIAGSSIFSVSGWRSKIFMLVSVVCIWPSLEQGSKFWRARPFKAHCPSDPHRIDAISTAVQRLETIGATRILAIGNLIPRLASLPDVEQVGASQSDQFNYFLVEKSHYRNTWPLSKEDFATIERSWREMKDVIVLQDDQYVLLMARTNLLENTIE